MGERLRAGRQWVQSDGLKPALAALTIVVLIVLWRVPRQMVERAEERAARAVPAATATLAETATGTPGAGATVTATAAPTAMPVTTVAATPTALTVKERLELEDTNRQTLAQIVGGVVLLIGVYFTWKNSRASEQKNVIDSDRALTERYTEAIEQLGSEKLEVRLGAIYALERIALDSERDHWPIMETLTAYIRERSPAPVRAAGSDTSDSAVVGRRLSAPLSGKPAYKGHTSGALTWIGLPS